MEQHPFQYGYEPAKKIPVPWDPSYLEEERAQRGPVVYWTEADLTERLRQAYPEADQETIHYICDEARSARDDEGIQTTTQLEPWLEKKIQQYRTESTSTAAEGGNNPADVPQQDLSTDGYYLCNSDMYYPTTGYVYESQCGDPGTPTPQGYLDCTDQYNHMYGPIAYTDHSSDAVQGDNSEQAGEGEQADGEQWVGGYCRYPQ